MTTVDATQPTSLVEMAARGVAGMMARRRQARSRKGRSAVGEYLTETLGTILAMACLTVAAFTAGAVLGFVASGVALLLVDFKVAVVRRSRSARRRS
jgi:hypothetical protein